MGKSGVAVLGGGGRWKDLENLFGGATVLLSGPDLGEGDYSRVLIPRT